MAQIRKKERVNFASAKNHVSLPRFSGYSVKVFQVFFQLETTPENREDEGLFKVFSENFPITDARNNFVLEFLGLLLSILLDIQSKSVSKED